jgi:MYXO-CTERM domain-containing protein
VRTWLSLGTSIALALLAAAAHAAPPFTTAGSSEKRDLLAQIQQDADALSAQDCAVACKALASMERATARLCEIEPGPTCDDARAKVEDAKRRVRAACPTCVAERSQDRPPEPSPNPSEVASTPATPAAAPPAEAERGGCRSCATSGGDEEDAGGLVITALLAATLLMGRRRQGRGPHGPGGGSQTPV